MTALLRSILIDARPVAAGGLDVSTRLLGLTLLARLVRAAERAGFDEVAVLAGPSEQGRLRLAAGEGVAVAILAALPEVPRAGPVALVPANLLGEVGWLCALRDAAPGEEEILAGPHGIRILGAEAPSGGAATGACVMDGAAPLSLAGASDLPRARARLLAGLPKATDGFMSRYFARPISIRISRRLADTRVSPNAMTLLSTAVGLLAAPFFLSPVPNIEVLGGLLFVLHSVLDGCDGELARLRFQESRFGGLLDFAGDNLVHVAVFACMALGWSWFVGAEWPLLLGFAAVMGTVGSAGAVYWLTLRPAAKRQGPVYTTVSAGARTRLTGMLDSLSRRDFIYAVLALSIFGRADWFLVPASIGAPVFFGLVVVAWLRSRRHGTAGTAPGL